MIHTYEMIVDTEKKNTSLQLKESIAYGRDIFNKPEEIFNLMKEVFMLHQKADEYVYLLAMNNKMKLIGTFEVSHGTGTASILDMRGIFMRALQVGASNIVMVHNHPSGFPLPSREDFKTCRLIRKAGVLMGIPLSDFIVIGSNGFVSFSEKELL